MADPFAYLNQEANRTAQTFGAIQQGLVQARTMQLREQEQMFNQSLNLKQLDLREQDMAFDQSIKLRQLQMEEKLQPLKMRLTEAQITAASRTGTQRAFKDQVKGLRDASIDPAYGVDPDDTINGELRKQQYEGQYNQMITEADNITNEGVALPQDPSEMAPLTLFDDRPDDPLTSALYSVGGAPAAPKAAATHPLDIMESAVKRAEKGIKGGTQEERLNYLGDLYSQRRAKATELAAKGDTKAVDMLSRWQTEADQASQLLTDPNVPEGPKVAARNTLLRLGLGSDRIDADIVKSASKERSVQQYNVLNDLEKQRYREYQDTLQRQGDSRPGQAADTSAADRAKKDWEAARRAAEQYGVQSGVIPPTATSSQSAAQEFLNLAKERLNRQ